MLVRDIEFEADDCELAFGEQESRCFVAFGHLYLHFLSAYLLCLFLLLLLFVAAALKMALVHMYQSVLEQREARKRLVMLLEAVH